MSDHAWEEDEQLPLHKGVLKDNFYESNCTFHHNLRTHHFLTPLGHQAFL
jgi:hypothetical protein